MTYAVQNLFAVRKRRGTPPRPDRPDFAAFVARLREARGLTQEQLAEHANVDKETISRVERGGSPWGARSARAVFEALFMLLPLTREEATKFLEHTGLDPKFYDAALQRRALAGPAADAEVDARFLRAASGLLLELARSAGHEQTLFMLRGAFFAVTTLKAAAEETQTLTVKGPPGPSPIPGAIEHTETDYEVKRPKKAG